MSIVSIVIYLGKQYKVTEFNAAGDAHASYGNASLAEAITRAAGMLQEFPEAKVEISHSDRRAELVRMIAAVAETQGTDLQGAFRDVLTDIRHVADDHGLDLYLALDGSYEVYLEERQAALESGEGDADKAIIV